MLACLAVYHTPECLYDNWLGQILSIGLVWLSVGDYFFGQFFHSVQSECCVMLACLAVYPTPERLYDSNWPGQILSIGFVWLSVGNYFLGQFCHSVQPEWCVMLACLAVYHTPERL